MAKRSLSPTEVYKLLPRTNCRECGEDNCMAFATKLVNREATLDRCPPLREKEHEASWKALWELLKPPVKEVIISSRKASVRIGGKLVMYRHELTYHNPTAVAIDVWDEMPEEDLLKRVKEVEGLSYEYIGRALKLDLIAVRSTSNDMGRFSEAVKTVKENTGLPLVLCSMDPNIVEAGLVAYGGGKPLIYAATRDNWKDMADLALMYKCPLAVSSPGDLDGLKSLARTLVEYGVEDLVLDPGTMWDGGLSDTINNFTMIRRAATKVGDELVGFPLLAVPATVWMSEGELPEVKAWREACLASMLIVRYADLLIMHSLEGWAILPILMLRENIYTDPRKPVAVESGLRTFGSPSGESPVLITSIFALTYYTVAADVESSGVNCYLLVVDTEGLSVESAVAGRKLTADKIAEALRDSKVEEKVEHRKLIIPGRASRLSGEIEELTGWTVLVGPLDSSEIPKFLQEKWGSQPRQEPGQLG
ncbi:MAG: acetyl-CoA decarbonylase/synthase complex subunit gamma [Candidatus Bathyarchaeia archaeon]